MWYNADQDGDGAGDSTNPFNSALTVGEYLIFRVGPLDEILPDAQATDLWFSGMYHTAEGQALLVPDPVNENLLVAEIGNTGDDGVTIQTGETDFFEVGLADLDPELMDAGATLEYSLAGPPGAGGSITSLSSMLAVVNDNGRFDLSADFSPLGTDSYTTFILNNGEIVYTEEGIPNGSSGLLAGEIKVVCMGSEVIDSIVIYLVVDIPSIITGGGSGPTITGDTICLVPTNPNDLYETRTSATILTSGSPNCTITKTAFNFKI